MEHDDDNKETAIEKILHEMKEARLQSKKEMIIFKEKIDRLGYTDHELSLTSKSILHEIMIKALRGFSGKESIFNKLRGLLKNGHQLSENN